MEEKPPVETLRDVRQLTQGTSADSETLNWNGWKNPAATGTELSHPSQEREENGALSTSPPSADVPSQPESSLASDESSRELCLTPARQRSEGREPVWLRDYVRTVAVYPAWFFNYVRTLAC